MSEFDFAVEVAETNWVVEGLIPEGHLCFILAQAGVGKSLLVEDLAVHITHGIDFCGFKTVDGDVLLIDQDTPTNVLAKRLIRFKQGLGDIEQKHKLFMENMKGYYLDNNTLTILINDYPTARLIIIDSFHSVCGRLDPNSTGDMAKLAKFKNICLNGQSSILFSHHISEKFTLTVDDLMIGQVNHLAMGNSGIIQQADTYYVVGAAAKDGVTERLYIRPISKRVSIASKPLILRVVAPEEGGETIVYEGCYEPDLEESELDVMTLFREQKLERTVKETYEAMGHKHGEKSIRQALASLERKGMLLLSRNKANLFKYRLP